VDRLQRRFLACLTAFAVLATIAQGVSGATDLVLFLTPLFLIAALLLCGRYIAEDRIVRRWRAAAARPLARRVRSRWRPVVEASPRLRLVHRPRPQRGPPALATA
jgi:hypothetical protein